MTTTHRTFYGLAILLLLLTVAQFFLAASGAFGAAADDASFRAHEALGWVLFALPALMAIGAAAARLPGRLVGLSALVAGQTSLQVGIAALATAAGDGTTTGQLIFGLHAVNGLAMLAVVGLIVRGSRTAATRPR